MMIKTHCKKCGNTFNLDIGDKTVEQITEQLTNQRGFHCDVGNHIELNSPMDYWFFVGDPFEGSAPSESEFLEILKRSHHEVFTTDELRDQFDVKGFSYFGACVAIRKSTGQKYILDFTHSPKHERYYYSI